MDEENKISRHKSEKTKPFNVPLQIAIEFVIEEQHSFRDQRDMIGFGEMATTSDLREFIENVSHASEDVLTSLKDKADSALGNALFPVSS